MYVHTTAIDMYIYCLILCGRKAPNAALQYEISFDRFETLWWWYRVKNTVFIAGELDKIHDSDDGYKKCKLQPETRGLNETEL